MQERLTIRCGAPGHVAGQIVLEAGVDLVILSVNQPIHSLRIDRTVLVADVARLWRIHPVNLGEKYVACKRIPERTPIAVRTCSRSESVVGVIIIRGSSRDITRCANYF